MLGLFDAFRIDHFRGFVDYWAVPAGETAREGHWAPGPGAAVFRAAERELGALPVIVEDLGVITPDVPALRDELGFPGMAILLWAFDGPEDNPHRLENHRVHQVVYTSTHDTDTLAGAFAGEPVWPLIELALSSRAALAMVPVQDVLGLGSEARMNRPGEVGGNWAWRLEPGQLGPEHAGRLRSAAEGGSTCVTTSGASRMRASPSTPLSPRSARARSSRRCRSRPATTCSISAAAGASFCCGSSPPTRRRPAPASTPARTRSTGACAPRARRGLHERVEFVEAAAETFVDLADVVVCVASLACVRRLGGRARVAPAERHARRPRALRRRLLGRRSDRRRRSRRSASCPRLDELHAAAEAAGFRIERAETSTPEEWDAFEAGWRAGLEASADPEAVAFAAERRREYEDGYRDAIGFAWLVLAPA